MKTAPPKGGRPPLAWRNNNPGNIRFVASIRWQGQEGEGEGGFARFKTPEHGFRALARQLMTYKERHDLDTLRKILTRYAPPQGSAQGQAYTQNTAGYIDKVARDMRVSPDAPINVQDWRTMLSLVTAIADYEDGAGWKWPEQTILDGLRMAGFDAPAPPAHRTPEMQVAAAATGAAGVGAIVAEVAPHVPVLADLAQRVGVWGLAALVGVVVLVLAYRRYAARQEAAS
jgi:hypothetical protein